MYKNANSKAMKTCIGSVYVDVMLDYCRPLHINFFIVRSSIIVKHWDWTEEKTGLCNSLVVSRSTILWLGGVNNQLIILCIIVRIF